MILEVGPLTGVITDAEGMFVIEDVPVGRYNLLVSYLGYESFIMRDVIVSSGKEVFLEVGMRENIIELEGVSVVPNSSRTRPLIQWWGFLPVPLRLKRPSNMPGVGEIRPEWLQIMPGYS